MRVRFPRTGGTVQLTGDAPITFSAQMQVCFALYTQPSTQTLSAPTPTPSPTSTPILPAATPSATPTVAPASSSPTPVPSPSSTSGVHFNISVPTPSPIIASLADGQTVSSLTFSGALQQQTVYISEAGYDGSFFAATTDPTVATATVGTDFQNHPIVTVESVRRRKLHDQSLQLRSRNRPI